MSRKFTIIVAVAGALILALVAAWFVVTHSARSAIEKAAPPVMPSTSAAAPSDEPSKSTNVPEPTQKLDPTDPRAVADKLTDDLLTKNLPMAKMRAQDESLLDPTFASTLSALKPEQLTGITDMQVTPADETHRDDRNVARFLISGVRGGEKIDVVTLELIQPLVGDFDGEDPADVAPYRLAGMEFSDDMIGDVDHHGPLFRAILPWSLQTRDAQLTGAANAATATVFSPIGEDAAAREKRLHVSMLSPKAAVAYQAPKATDKASPATAQITSNVWVTSPKDSAPRAYVAGIWTDPQSFDRNGSFAFIVEYAQVPGTTGAYQVADVRPYDPSKDPAAERGLTDDED